MPEEKTNSPGNVPGEKNAVRHPTVMPPGGHQTPPNHRPTIMEGPGSKTPKPTMINVPQKSSPSPTRMTSTTPAKVERKEAPPVVKPSAMPGTVRQRIPVTLAELQNAQAKIQQPVLERALHLVQEFSPDTVNDNVAILWGNEIQQRNSAVVSQGLELSRSEIFVKTSKHIARMMEILGLIKLEKVFGKNSNGFFARALGRASREIDTPEELEEAEREIEQLVALVNGSIGQLLDLKAQSEKLSAEVERVRSEAEAASIAALYIADYLTKHSRRDLAELFTERSMSLTATCAQIRGGSSIRLLQIEQPLQLINVVQNVVLVTLPGLIASISALQTMMKSSKPTVTQIDELGDQIQKTLQSLKF